jgi:cold-inducible RNA-binding protein
VQSIFDFDTLRHRDLTVPQLTAEKGFNAFLSASSARSQIVEEIQLKSIFVGNLDFGVTEDMIRPLFEAHGAVERVTIMTDRDTGRSRGFAFVEMTNGNEADEAIKAVNGTNLSGRALNVNEARPKPARRSGPGGGGPPRQRREPRW